MTPSNVEGAAAELFFGYAALMKGYDVYYPANGTQAGHDLIMHRDDKWSRIQVKKALVHTTSGSTRVHVTLHHVRKGRNLNPDFDYIAVVCRELEQVWLLPKEAVTQVGTLSKAIPRLSEWDRYKF